MNHYSSYKSILKICCILICGVESITLPAQDPYHIRYGIEDGLPSEEIYDVEQDNKGRIWLATDRGVARYNGYEFISFDKKDGLATNTILKMFKDSKGRFWFSGYDGSLSFWANETFYTIPEINVALKTKYPGKWIEAIFEQDSSTYILQFSAHGGLSKSGTIVLNLSKKSISIEPWPDSKDEKTIVGKSDVFKRQGNLIKSTDNDFIWNNSIQEDESDYMFFIDRFTKSALTRFKIPTYRSSEPSNIFIIKNDSLEKEIDFPLQIEDVLQHNGKIIIGSWEGLITLDSENINSKLEYFKDRLITGLLIDNEENLWISTQNDGLIFLPYFSRIKQLPITIGNERPANVKIFKNHLFVTYMRGAGLEIFDESLLKVYGLYDKSSIFYSGLAIDEDKVRTSNGSLISYKGGKFQFSANTNSGNTLESPSRVNLKLNNGDYLRGTTGVIINGHNYLDTSEIKFKIFKSPYSAFQLTNGNILVGCVDSLFEINGKTYSCRSINDDKDIRIGSRVNHIIPYNDKLTLFSTLGDGILIYDHASHKIIRRITIQNGLLSNQVNSAFLESDSIIWAGTNFGLSRISVENTLNQIDIKTVNNITTKEGLFSNFISSITKWKDDIWVVTTGGTNYFKTEELLGNTYPPSIFIDSTVLLRTKDNVSAEEELEYDENDLSFHFTGVTFRKPINDNFYKYRLNKSGQQSDWLSTNNRSIQFTNLDAGDYNFQINAKNQYEQWATHPADFSFSIKKHFSDTFWFRLLCIMSIGILGYLIFRNRREALISEDRQKQKLREAELNIKAAELNALRNQMNPHFIYNALNSIQNFIFKDDPEKANYMLSRFGKLMRSSLELSKLEYISFEKEIEFLENYLQLEKMRFGDKFNYNFKIDSAIKDSFMLPPLLIQPIIENCIKHGFSLSGANGEINIEFRKQNELIRVSVLDNGKGYSRLDDRSKYTESPTALKIIKERIELLNKVNDHISSFDIKPLIKNNSVIGTEVTLQIPYKSEALQ